MTTFDTPTTPATPAALEPAPKRPRRRREPSEGGPKGSLLSRGLLYLIALGAVVTYVFPLLFLLNTALKAPEQFLSDPIGLTPGIALSNFVDAWNQGNFGAYFVNSILYTGVSATIATILTLMLAFPVARGYIRGSRSFWPAVFVVALFLPNALTSQFQLMLHLGLYNSRIGYILLMSGAMGLGPLLVMGYLRSLPRELDEAAAIDGCGYYRYLFTMVAPLIRPVLVTVFILHCIGTWNDIILSTIYFADPEKYPVSVGLLAFKGQYTNDWALLAAGVLIVAIPLVILYAFMQKYIVAGVTQGALKS